MSCLLHLLGGQFFKNRIFVLPLHILGMINFDTVGWEYHIGVFLILLSCFH